MYQPLFQSRSPKANATGKAVEYSVQTYSKAEHAPGLDFGQCQGGIDTTHRAPTTASGDSLNRFVLARGRYPHSALEHLARSRENTDLYGHVSLRLFEYHSHILDRFACAATWRHVLPNSNRAIKTHEALRDPRISAPRR